MTTPTRPSWVPSSAIYWRGHWFDPTTHAMLLELARLSGALYIQPIQGSWSTSTKASGKTHAGACVVDVNAERWTDAQAEWVETLWRMIGGFGWFRPVLYRADGSRVWQRHLHLGRNGSGMAPELATQYGDYLAGYNGLPIGNRTNRDTGTRAYVDVTWTTYQAQLADEENLDMTPDELRAIVRAEVERIPDIRVRHPLIDYVADPKARTIPLQEVWWGDNIKSGEARAGALEAVAGIATVGGQLAGILEALRQAGAGEALDLEAVTRAAYEGGRAGAAAALEAGVDVDVTIAGVPQTP